MPMSQSLPVAMPPNADYTKQSYEVPGTRRPGQTGHYRGTAFPFLSLDTPHAFTNLVEFFDSGRSRVPSGDFPFLGQRPVISKNPLKFADHYEWLSWDTVDVRRRQVGSGVHKLFVDGRISAPLRIVGIYSGNSPAWQLVDLATHAYELVSVSLYDTLGKDTVEYIINHTDMPIIFVAVQHIPRLLRLSSKLPTLKIIVAMEPLEFESKTILTAWGEQVGIKVMDLSEVEEIGKANLQPPVYPSPDAIATICYTSGTTGQPKGVVMTHGMVANACFAQLHGLNFKQLPTALVFLPLAHCYGRMTVTGIIGRGGSLGFWSNDPLLLLEDMKILRPTMLPAVPRVLNRIYQAGMAAAKLPGVKGALFRRALQVKLDRLHATGVQTHAFWDRLVFRKIQDAVGGQLLMISTGSAPMSPAALDFLKVGMNADVMEGYGSTENVGTATRTWPWDYKAPGTVGPPQPNTEMKLVDVPTMGYTSEDKPRPRGEICLRSDACFKSYYKDEESTKSAIDAEGWQHTGDVGEIDECGRFRIIDRVKNIMKLAQGEYVALERVESMYNACPVVAQLYVHGDSLQSYLLGVVVPDPVQLAELASKVWGRQVSEKDLSALQEAARDEKVKAAVLHELTKQAKIAGLQGFETIKRIHVTNELFTVDNNCLTPTMKIKRKEVAALYKKELDAMYAMPEPTSGRSRGPKL